MAFAMVPIQSATQYDCDITGKSPEQIMQILKDCGYHFVGLKYPCLNTIGLILLIAGFFIQFLPAIPKIVLFGETSILHGRSVKFHCSTLSIGF